MLPRNGLGGFGVIGKEGMCEVLELRWVSDRLMVVVFVIEGVCLG